MPSEQIKFYKEILWKEILPSFLTVAHLKDLPSNYELEDIEKGLESQKHNCRSENHSKIDQLWSKIKKVKDSLDNGFLESDYNNLQSSISGSSHLFIPENIFKGALHFKSSSSSFLPINSMIHSFKNLS
jgi:hypothetical protein